jgi:hypothetical protein
MLAKRVGEFTRRRRLELRPQWDGSGALICRDRNEILIQSSEKSLNRTFPELLEPLRSELPARPYSGW